MLVAFQARDLSPWLRSRALRAAEEHENRPQRPSKANNSALVSESLPRMSNQAPINDIDGFCRILAASGLVGGDWIASALADFRAHAARDSKYGASFTAFTKYLVANGIVTCWQCAKLRNGQYKGFFLDGYKLLDHIGADPSCSRYLAEDSRTGQCVVLCFKPLSVAPLRNGNPQYWVEDFHP